MIFYELKSKFHVIFKSCKIHVVLFNDNANHLPDQILVDIFRPAFGANAFIQKGGGEMLRFYKNFLIPYFEFARAPVC